MGQVKKSTFGLRISEDIKNNSIKQNNNNNNNNNYYYYY